MLRADELIVDLFAGGGGASQGIFEATGRHPDIAINHDADAVAVHTRNHPTTTHYCQSIWQVRPRDAVGDRSVGLLWASPDCRHFSRAAGGRPKWKSVRSLPGVVLTWAKHARPRVIVVENVQEMQDWGPLLDDGTPCPDRIGLSFRIWCGRLRGLGYKVEFRRLCAADYGAPTIRTRLFIVARCDGAPIVWPQPTHQRGASLLARPWRSAADCIDWSIPCPSIFDRSRPLKDATMRRIADGVMRYVVQAGEPFIVRIGHWSHKSGQGFGFRGQGIDAPMSTITSVRDKALVTATVGGDAASYVMPITHQGPRRGTSLDEPMPTLTCANRGEHALISAHISDFYGTGTGRDVADPLGTITASGGHHALVAAFLAQHNTGVTGRDMREPVSTITAAGTQQALVTAELSDEDRVGADRVSAFLIHYYSNGGQMQDVRQPLGAITTKARFGLVTVAGRPIVDIGMRMLARHELQAAQGFGPDYDLTDDGRLTKTASIRLIGNSVCPPVAAAVVRANVRPLVVADREAA